MPDPSAGRAGKGAETFHYAAWAWDVTQALERVAGRPPTESVAVEAWARQLLPPLEDPTRLSVMGVRIDHEYALGPDIDLSKPLLAVTLEVWDDATQSVQAYTMLIDGHHRLFRAWHDGVATLPLVRLDEKEERRVRLRGPYPTKRRARRSRGTG
jgi:hypothetical protein